MSTVQVQVQPKPVYHPRIYRVPFRVRNDSGEFIPFWYKLMLIEGPENAARFILDEYSGRVVLLNAVVGYRGFMYIDGADIYLAQDLVHGARALNRPIESYIGHESTANILSRALVTEVKVNRGIYTPQQGDVSLVFRLAGRPQGDVKEIRLEDLEISIVYYL